MSYYDILGIPKNASPDEVQHAYLAKASQLHPEQLTGAPEEVVRAVTNAVAIVKEAGRVLQDPALRADYDRTLELEEAGKPQSHGNLNDNVSTPSSTSSFDQPLYDVADALEAHAAWSEPNAAVRRGHVIVPDVCNKRASEVFYAVADSGLQINFVRLTENPAPVDGIVVAQSPAAGTSVRRHSSLTVEVWHPSADDLTKGRAASR